MPQPAMKKYLASSGDPAQADSSVWFDAGGRAQGRYFNSTLTSAFQAIRALDSGRALGFEGFARTYSATDQGLCVWKLLDRAANDQESVWLDRLCRMLHAINFFRQQAAQGADLFVSVHARLLAAVEGNHGDAFRRILASRELSHERIVLQLPAVTRNQNWILNSVSENYRQNGFRVAVKANTVQEAQVLLDHVRPDVIKLDARHTLEHAATLKLLEEAGKREIQLVFKRVEGALQQAALQELGRDSGQQIRVQGLLWDLPQASLAPVASSGTLFSAASSARLRRRAA